MEPTDEPTDRRILRVDDDRDIHRFAFLLWSDRERRALRRTLRVFDDVDQAATLAWVLDQAARRRELLMIRDERRRWYETAMGQVALAVGILAGLFDLIASVKILTGR